MIKMTYRDRVVIAVLKAAHGAGDLRVRLVPDQADNRNDLFILATRTVGGEWLEEHSVCRGEDPRLTSLDAPVTTPYWRVWTPT